MRLAATASGLTVADYWAASNTVSESAGDIDLARALHCCCRMKPMPAAPFVTCSLAQQRRQRAAARSRFAGQVQRQREHCLSARREPVARRPVLGVRVFQWQRLHRGCRWDAQGIHTHCGTAAGVPDLAIHGNLRYPGSSPSVSANGSSNAVVWTLTSSSSGAAILHAYNPANLQQEYYNSTQAANSRDASAMAKE